MITRPSSPPLLRVRSRASLEVELIALRHRVTVLAPAPGRRRLFSTDRPLWVWLYRVRPQVFHAMALVAGNLGPGGTEKGFRIYWRWRSWSASSAVADAAASKPLDDFARSRWINFSPPTRNGSLRLRSGRAEVTSMTNSPDLPELRDILRVHPPRPPWPAGSRQERKVHRLLQKILKGREPQLGSDRRRHSRQKSAGRREPKRAVLTQRGAAAATF
jgi:hypothetical protein